MQNTSMIDTHLTESVTGISLNCNKIFFLENVPRMCASDVTTGFVYGVIITRCA